ncbi:RHS repeat protein [Pseudomonas fluorescens]|uniref:Putative insecticidal toxin n=2 Tax=Pseudomonas fluorescens TaxID=294 RepID=Q3KHR6_PSEPF|nr:RHS repeat-associated core domain-containing protein [Pseudomonas fluorescens]ABA72690.1 putative insecticidal toxin [Pseudomonas fluorescens Pf0-1]MBY9023105.1 RHS repeat protein [Pseudomonas fluorescens]MBY9029097.1 RHS repeat protein [Pseudomonas fluorescens]MBY9034685.1 RHS repeat protein [Pseudomonas fluorescens]MBY9040748.1 RHS repeat protein [Pseudomonas fluorescens]
MSLHINTPRMSVVDPRGLPVRTVDYCRDIEDGPVESRINRTLHDAAGRALKQWAPRLWLSQADDRLTPANLTQVFALDATVIRSDSVDAGTQVELKGLAAQTLFSWDSRQTRREIEHDNLLRPVAIFEEGTGVPRRCVERLTYGHPGSGDQSRNQFGQLIRHDHPAGSVLFTAFAIIGACTEDTRHFTLELLAPDWPEREADRLRLLEPGVGATSRWRHGALGEVLGQTDARDNRHTFELTVDGRLREHRLQLKGEREQILVTDIRYDAQGNVTQETAGNGVHTTRTYRSEDGSLLDRRAEDADGRVRQHLLYEYDRMRNVLSIEDKALPIRYFANQRIEPVSHFFYDSLYRLTKACGWEAGTASQGPQSMGRVDPAAISNYQQTYKYDADGNLCELIHLGPQDHGRKLRPASYSNRSLPYKVTPPTDAQIEAAYDRRGNLLQLEPGWLLSWNLRNQLQSVSPVERASGINDSETYLYDGSSQRVRKIRSLLTNARTLVADVRYLPGLELRTDNGTGERLQVITADGIRVLRWESPPPWGVNIQYRYQHVDHLGSVSLETADDGAMISRETFHPFGTSAWQDGEFSYKYIRYSGKERDASGLDYYRYRYYIPWLQHWLNPDPAGDIDGLNLYRMVRNNPLTMRDALGLQAETGTYEAEVGIRVRLAFKLLSLQAHVSKLDPAGGRYSKSADFKLVEVGEGPEFSVSKGELLSHLRTFRRQYREMYHDSLRQEDPQSMNISVAQNFELGKEIAEITSSSLKYSSEPRVSEEQTVTKHFFALINRDDVEKKGQDKVIYGIAELSVVSKKGGESTVHVSNVLAHPLSQPGVDNFLGESAEATGAIRLFKLRGIGTYLTVKSLARMVRTHNVQKVRTAAVNPRSAAIARRLGARKVN